MKTNELITKIRSVVHMVAPPARELLEQAADALEECRMHSAECRMKWIPVTERLPEYSDGHVLVTDGEQVKISCRNACYQTASGEVRCAQGYGLGMPVTHWMPLPEPPKEGT